MLKNEASASPAMALASRVLPVPGRADHQDAFGNAPAEFLKFLRVLQEFDQFGNLLLGFLNAGHVLESDLVLFLVQHAGAAFAETHRAFAGHFDLAENEEVQGGQNQDERQPRVQEKRSCRGCRCWVF